MRSLILKTKFRFAVPVRVQVEELQPKATCRGLWVGRLGAAGGTFFGVQIRAPGPST